MGTSYRERSSVHEGRYGCPVTKKTFDGEKNRWDWRLHADSVQEDIRGKERRGSFGSLRMPESVVASLAGHIVVGLHRLLWPFRF